MRGKQGAPNDLSHLMAGGASYQEGTPFKGGRSKSHFGQAEKMPIRHPSGNIRKAGGL